LLHCSTKRSIGSERLKEHNMSATRKSSGVAAASGQIDSLFTEFARGVGAGLEQLATLQQQALEVALQQNRQLISVWQKGAALTVDGVQQSAQVQKDLFEVAVERSRVVSRLASDNVESATKAAAGVAAVLESVGGQATAAQKQAIEFAAAQSATVYGAAQQQLEASSSAAADALKRGVDTVLETQRALLRARDAA
jgi:hypothetical protein